jgi:hypothetical protein
MRCATPTTIYAFTGTGTTRGTYSGLTVGAEGATCTAVQYVVLTPAELNQYTTSPFQLSLSEAGSIVSAILAVWALGFGIRMLVRAMRSDSTTIEGE